MGRFIGRQCEMAELDSLTAEPGSQFLILYGLYGRRRVGKTTLLLHWAQESNLPFVYWVASRLSPTLQLRSLSQTLYNASHPDAPADADFTYPTWEMALAQAAQMAADRRVILILDEFPYIHLKSLRFAAMHNRRPASHGRSRPHHGGGGLADAREHKHNPTAHHSGQHGRTGGFEFLHIHQPIHRIQPLLEA